jgi:DNA-directed RNA polymerase specialized sigma24 family protein
MREGPPDFALHLPARRLQLMGPAYPLRGDRDREDDLVQEALSR